MANAPKTPPTPLRFEPLSEGLGFHPFSDGLPYAPVSKVSIAARAAASASGSGATAAGPARPVRTPSLPTGAPVPQRVSHPLRMPQAQPQAAPAPVWQRPAPAPQRPAEAPQPARFAQPALGFGYVLKRVFAYLADTIFNLCLCGGALCIALWKLDLSPMLLVNPSVAAVAALFLCFFNWALVAAQEVAFGTSLGKRLFGLAVHGSASAVFLRAFFFLPAICFGGIGLLWALFDRRRRCWHDLVVDLQPVELARL